ncbi:hypothetical protein ASG99_13715 [Bacillus sp. Soil768D1]|nr:hypothetical protein ASG99_13715 [Bacillus sp. Soil768D1]
MEDVINDRYLEVFENKPSKKILKEIKDNLPAEIYMAAEAWGWNDTVVGDDIYKWIRKHKDTLK